MEKPQFPGWRQDIRARRYFRHPPEMETERLRLRPLRWGDAAQIYDWSRDPEVARYVLWDAHRSIRETREYIAYMRGLYRRSLPGSWAVVEKAANRVIGTMGVVSWSPENGSCEIGYSLARDRWGLGYATEAAERMIRSLMEDAGFHRIEAQHDVRNPASGRVMEKCGMRKEGVLRGRILNKGEYVDVVLYAILAEDRT
ncbi:MAG: GNAT family N-acetyltransferase [Clostridia bacterium]|nr:GNAT family N-acetyltransferase [Clostridia bacterium]